MAEIAPDPFSTICARASLSALLHIRSLPASHFSFKRRKSPVADVSSKTCSDWVSVCRRSCFFCRSVASPDSLKSGSRPCRRFMGRCGEVPEVLFEEPVDGGHHRRWIS
ncbi:hypothetical protein F2P81_012858 [Scophthalmus maximus]|uniref:Uncharacterized protein n=1 Tax=Scophthalmus maximus TaxID=52904 RepID=A0A6A4ST76_SCOMX|nr:hypothetical protein F2P81_012858 [Scophthalmus maximus]